MDRLGPALIVLAILLLLYAGMALGWRARKRRQAGYSAAPETPQDAGQLLLEAPMLYVATTPANQPLERLTIPGLAFRARGTFIVWEKGITLSLDGERDVFVPLARIRSIGTSTYTIDRVVESGGLVRLDWISEITTTGDATTADVESYARILDSGDSIRVLSTVQSLLQKPQLPMQEGSIA
ncbi:MULTISPECIES: hypothetical protein [Subtercola]|uniref:PH domain-containing protein n=1 Tax=Subtercola vilae TaxID=2056433 RepID=A0A4T2C143_9MICO|nr:MULTISPECIES: hypothetical protein [Subtercola]MEA9985104.1 hypothetical protein [Subtercola sp. RTI3]TIH37697.1 hypothetical protein D4765_07880 [Subtercola vilae]